MSKAAAFQTWEEAVVWLRRQPDQQELVLAAYYDDPLLAAAQRYRQSPEWHAIRELLPAARGKALDIGAGRGIASYALAREGFDVTALEPDGSEVVGAGAIRALAQAAGVPIQITQEFSERLPLPDASVDVVFARAVLHHTRDLAAACREVLRVLRPGGTFLAVREHVISRREHLPAFLDAHPLHRYYGGENAFLLQEYEQAIDAAGFVGRRTLAPLESVINFAPKSLAAMQHEISLRLTRGHGALTHAMDAAWAIPGLWPVARRIFGLVDHRPGRLYSFTARRPS